MELEILAVMGPLKRKKISLSVPFKSTNLLIGKKVDRRNGKDAYNDTSSSYQIFVWGKGLFLTENSKWNGTWF